jgi:exosortase/archaeosortase family protein
MWITPIKLFNWVGDYLKKDWFHVILLIIIALPIITLCFLDYYNIEGYNYRYNQATDSFDPWNNVYFNENFTFDVTWKGRMFLGIFAWFIVMESIIGWSEIRKKTPTNRYLMAGALGCALIPTGYVLATNFLGLDLAVLKYGQSLGLPFLNVASEPSDFLQLFWPLSVEYVLFFVFFTTAFMLAYRPRGLKIFAISLAVLGGFGVAYMIDTLLPFGVLKPLQEMALPTAAVATALFDLCGFSVMMSYPNNAGGSLVPALTVVSGSSSASISIAWACAGVQSLFLFLVIMLLFFKKTNITPFRRLLYFTIGLFGTFFANVLRICAVTLILLFQGGEEGMFFHNNYGELFGFSFIFAYILLIIGIERFMIVEKTRNGIRKVGVYLQNAASGSPSKRTTA